MGADELAEALIKADLLESTYLTPPDGVVSLPQACAALMRRLVARVQRLEEALWPGLPAWIPTEAEAQQDFYEACAEALHKRNKP